MEDLRNLLQTERVLKLRNGDYAVVIGNSIIGKHACLDVTDYDKNLTYVNENEKYSENVAVLYQIKKECKEFLSGELFRIIKDNDLDKEKFDVVWKRLNAKNNNITSKQKENVIMLRDSNGRFIRRHKR